MTENEKKGLSDLMQAPIDLEKVRDDKCIPLAREILLDMSTDLIPQDPSVQGTHEGLVLKMIQKMLDADTNIVMENSYIFQLILAIFAGLNVILPTCDTTPIDDVRYNAIARKWLSIIAEGNIKMGTLKPDEITAEFASSKEKINAIITEEKLTTEEIKYVMEKIFTGFAAATRLFSSSIEKSTRRAESKSFGIEDMDDLSMKSLNDFLEKQ